MSVRTRLQEITEKRNPTIHELRLLYAQNVCGAIHDKALQLFTERELKRHICIALYRDNIIFRKRGRYWVIDRICMLLGLAKRTVEKYCPARRKEKELSATNADSSNI